MLSGLCSTSVGTGGRPRSRCCSSTCCRNSDTWDWRSSFSWRSRRCRASHFSSSLVRWISRAVAALLPGREKMPWLEMRLGTVWCGAGTGCSGCCTGLGACKPVSFSFSVGGNTVTAGCQRPHPCSKPRMEGKGLVELLGNRIYPQKGHGVWLPQSTLFIYFF